MEVNKTNNQANLESELKFAPLDLPKDTNNLINAIVSGVNKYKVKHIISHSEIFDEILEKAESIDFEDVVFPKLKEYKEQLNSFDFGTPKYKQLSNFIKKLTVLQNHFKIVTIEKLSELIKKENFDLAKRNGSIFVYNGAYWKNVDEDETKEFLKAISLKFGVEKYNAIYHRYIDDLYKQLLSSNYLKLPKQNINKVNINLLNGTFEINEGKTYLREFRKDDFLTYQLKFDYNPDSEAPLFKEYLNKVLPDIDTQKILAEYIGYIFLKHGNNIIKEEKVLMLYGSGANGKSVFYEVISALLGKENITSYSLQSLTNETGYQRAKLENVLLNYAPEISSKMNPTIFKQLASGEEVEARLPYGEPFIMNNYAKFLFNCNELPKDTEQTNGYFRRFMIIPFNVIIPKEEQDKNLHNKIIENELSGVLNWVLEGLQSLLNQKGFTHSEIVNNMLNQFKLESDSVAMFIDEGYTKSTKGHYLVSDLYKYYREYCSSSGFVSLNQKNFKRRLEALSIEIKRTSAGNIVYVEFNKECPF